MADISMRRFLLGRARTDQGHILENVVYLELLRRGYDVHVGHMPGGEVDFIAQDGEHTEYYQVAATVLDANTLRRELASLEKIADHHPKFLLTLDEIGAGANVQLHISAFACLHKRPDCFIDFGALLSQCRDT